MSRSAWALMLAAAIAVGGCSSSVVDSMPQWAGGLAPETPQRPAAPPDYPPVNDRPPPRATKLISEEEQTKVENELTAARAKQEARAKEVQKGRAQMLANPPQPPQPPPIEQQQ